MNHEDMIDLSDAIEPEEMGGILDDIEVADIDLSDDSITIALKGVADVR